MQKGIMNAQPPLIDIHTHRKHADGRIFIRNAYLGNKGENVQSFPYPVSCGIHPWFITERYEDSLANLEQCLHLPSVYAVGECGLDYLCGTDKATQKKVLTAQLELAASHGLPVILHMVRSLHDLIPMIRKHTCPVVVHDYHGSEEVTRQLLKEEVCFSLGNYFIKNEQKVRGILKMIPADRLFAETDVHRHELTFVYSRIAAAMGITEGVLREQLYSNFVQVFKRYNEKYGN